jgi:hypothetical protein
MLADIRRMLKHPPTLLHVWTAPGAQGLLLDLALGTSAVMCPALVPSREWWKFRVVAAVLEIQRRTIETADLEARLAAIEAGMKGKGSN